MRNARIAMLTFAVATVAGLAGCASESDTDPAPSTTSEHGSFAHCLTEHGVTESAVSPAGPPAGVDQDTWDKAMQACGTLGPGPAGP